MDVKESLRLGREVLQDNACPSKNEAIFLYDLIHELQETCRKERDYNKRLLEKITHYERALKKISCCEFRGWSGSDVLGKVIDFATEVLKEN